MTLFLVPFLIAYLLLFVLILKHGCSLRTSLLYASIVFGVIIFGLTELLSLFNAISKNVSLIAWILIDMGLLIALYFIDKQGFMQIFSLKKINDGFLLLKSNFLKQDLTSKIFLIISLCFILILSFIASFAYPNNHDTMIYHLPRVLHWIQNHNVEHYATHIIRQIYSNPFSEYILLQLMLFGKDDRIVNFVQFFCMIGSLIGVSLIVKHFGGSARTQIYTAFITLTIPMGIIQAPNSQNDYILTYWLVCFVYTSLLLISSVVENKNSIFLAALSGASLGLAILTKGSTYVLAFPLCLFLGIYCLYKFKLKYSYLLATIIIVTLLINIPHCYRNYKSFNHLLVPKGELTELYMVNEFSIKGFSSSLIRNIGLNFNLSSFSVDKKVENLVNNFHKAINYRINETSTTIGSFYRFPKFTLKTKEMFNDFYSSNPIHLILIFLSLLLFFYKPFYRSHKGLFVYSLLLLSSFLFFCLLIKWQPFAIRLQLPLFVLFTPLIGCVFAYAVKLNLKLIVYFLLLLLTYCSLPYLFFSDYRSILGEKSFLKLNKCLQYYVGAMYLYDVQMPCLDNITYYRKNNIGIMLDADDFEYPLWVILRENNQSCIIKHVKVKNFSGNYEDTSFEPEVIIDYTGIEKRVMF